MSQILDLPWGKDKISFTLPEAWQLTGELEPSPLPGVPDTSVEVRRSLQTPIRASHLIDLCHKGTRVAIVIDDVSRPTPVVSILPVVLDELAQGGVSREDIRLVIALGVHRPMQEQEVEQRVGASAMQGLGWQNHACCEPDQMTSLGTTQRGTPVSINKTVAQADLIVSIGSIEPHLIASFGGGYKNLIPGVAGRETVAHNHALNCTPHTFNMVGQPIERNPMRLDLEEGCRMLKQPVFIVNAVLNSAGQVVRIVSGDPIAAHREGVKISQAIYGVGISAPADIVISDSHPMDQDLRQGSKALANTIWAVRPGGVQLVLMRAVDGLGEFGLAHSKLPLGRSALQRLSPVLVRLVPRLKLKGMPDDERFFLYFALQAMRHCTLLVYAPTVPAEARAGLPFAQFVESPEAALAIAQRLLPRSAQVLAFPHGGVTYPIL